MSNAWPSKFKLPRLFAVVLVMMASAIALPSSKAWADDMTTVEDEVGLDVGYILPSLIHGVTDVMPVWGLRYGIGTSYGEIELDELTSHAAGVDYYNASGGFRGSAPMFPGASAIFFGGLDLTIYRPIDTKSHLTNLGFHFGGGLMMRLFDSLWFRTDARITNGPGSILGINVGLLYRGI